MSKVYNKLVRDKIIEIIEAKSEIPTYETLKDDRYLSELHKKLFEEANEFCENDDPEEFADLLEVLYAIAKFKNIDLNEVEKIRKQKAQQRGAFEKRIYLKEVTQKGE